jgi:hypothetical protein
MSWWNLRIGPLISKNLVAVQAERLPLAARMSEDERRTPATNN